MVWLVTCKVFCAKQFAYLNETWTDFDFLIKIETFLLAKLLAKLESYKIETDDFILLISIMNQSYFRVIIMHS